MTLNDMTSKSPVSKISPACTRSWVQSTVRTQRIDERKIWLDRVIWLEFLDCKKTLERDKFTYSTVPIVTSPMNVGSRNCVTTILWYRNNI